MSKRKLGLLLAFAGLLTAGTVAWAEKMESGAVAAVAQDDFFMPAHPHMGPPMMFNAPVSPMAGAMHLMMMLDDLDLDTKQREEVGKVMDSTLPRARDLMFRMSDMRKAVDKAMDEGVTDEKTLRKLADDQGRLIADMAFLHLKARADLRAVLNEEQIGKLEGMGQGRPFVRRFHGKHHD